jgi:2-hydroxychromene-2-carboxylate isomerase
MYITQGIGPPGRARPTLPRRHRWSNEMESFRQALGAIYVALADAAGGEQVLQGANRILTAAVDTGAVDDPYARAALRALIHSTSLTLDEGICGVTNRNGLLPN